MIKLPKQRMQQMGNHKLKPKKMDPFPIVKVVNDNACIINLSLILQISHTFNISYIAPYYSPDQANMQLSELESSFEEERDAAT